MEATPPRCPRPLLSRSLDRDLWRIFSLKKKREKLRQIIFIRELDSLQQEPIIVLLRKHHK